ncbi:hypothetical protein HDU97_006618 [Phlyctochytrium planicorne]|nr:hypothetical protein HDU97_006618 [Phlyctochytrium planicorne]
MEEAYEDGGVREYGPNTSNKEFSTGQTSTVSRSQKSTIKSSTVVPTTSISSSSEYTTNPPQELSPKSAYKTQDSIQPFQPDPPTLEPIPFSINLQTSTTDIAIDPDNPFHRSPTQASKTTDPAFPDEKATSGYLSILSVEKHRMSRSNSQTMHSMINANL